jgi:HlyD family secretion protein
LSSSKLSSKKSRKRLWIILAVVLFVLVGSGFITAKSLSGNNKIDSTQIATAELGDIARSVVATGKVQPITQVEVKSKASGIVTGLDVDINAQVRKGVQFDRVAAEAPDLPDWERNWQRAEQMQKDGVLSKQNADQAQQQYLSAKNARDRALAQITVDQGKQRQAAAQVAQAQASLKQLEEQLSYTTVTSPIDGVVLSRDVQMGDAVSSILVLGSTATLVMTLGDTHQVYVKGKVDESDIGKVYMGQGARIKVQSFPGKSFVGKVTKIAPLGVEKDNVTTFEVQISIDNPGGELKANMTANAEIVLEEHKGVITVPEQAVMYDKDRNASVWVPDPSAKDGHRSVGIKVGIANGSRIEVLSGLKAGDKVVLQQTS